MIDYDEQYYSGHISGWHRASFPAISQFIRTNLAGPAGLKVVDLGCGDGFYGPTLRPFAAKLIGVDFSSEALALAGRRLYDEVYRQDLGAPLASGLASAASDADVVFSTEVVEHIDNYATFFRTARSLLRSGGRLLLTTTMYYHYLFHGLMVDRSTLRNCGLNKYLGGFLSPSLRKSFVMRFSSYTGGHYYGFSKRQLLRAISSAHFRLERFNWLYAGEVVPTHTLRGNVRRFHRRGIAHVVTAKMVLLIAESINRTVETLGLPGPNCLIVATAV